ncbi:HAD-IA family hydrolase [Helicobacter pylori]|jgi:HAD superfamily hydrolase (TIGR01509 family)|uniref:HAD family hydrolase n=1 Tax=Calidithermus timidus TaxID=307124 RepID=UPI00036AB78C|nr:HAD-IA family hydrolase [Calidithermus timidus]MWR20498.1 HAD-IA family hydrolase [Helicobacter pylori]MWR36312.1 HAD-IA family hydrolase [Helicobacter pylori]
MKALVFDFDGTILDTEQAEYTAWTQAYARYGGELTLHDYLPLIGTAEPVFDLYAHLEAQIGPYDREAFDRERQEVLHSLLAQLEPLPGVPECLEQARKLGLKLAVASSSSAAWVLGHLEQHHLLQAFDHVITREYVARTKPDPALFLKAAEALQVAPAECVAVEDSLNGVRAARAAGMFTIAVPNPLTRHQDLRQADVLLPSLAGLELEPFLSSLKPVHPR